MTYSTSSTKHIPQRSCVVCHAKSEKAKLIRIVRSPEGLAVIDVSGKLQARGVYICPDDECIKRAEKSGVLSRSLGITVNQDFYQELREHSDNYQPDMNLKIRSILGLSRKAGMLVIGTDNIKASKHKMLVMSAQDCSESVREFVSSRDGITLNMTIEELSEASGSRGGVQVTALPFNSGFAKRIISLIH